MHDTKLTVVLITNTQIQFKLAVLVLVLINQTLDWSQLQMSFINVETSVDINTMAQAIIIILL